MARTEDLESVLCLNVIQYLIERRGSLNAVGAVLNIARPVLEPLLSGPSESAHECRRCEGGGDELDEGSLIHRVPENKPSAVLLSRLLCRQIDDLSWVHPVVRVQGALDHAHDVERFSVLIREILHFPIADTVLAGASTTHVERSLDCLFRESVSFLEVAGIVGIEDTENMKIAVAYM